MIYTSSLNVAGGRGLPVPLTNQTHHVRVKVSSAPAFLQRTVAELSALDKPDLRRVKRTPRVKAKRQPPTPPPAPVATTVDVQRLAADYTGGLSLRQAGSNHGLGEVRTRRFLEAAGITIRCVGWNGKVGNPMPPAQLDNAALCAEYEAGASLRDIAAKWHTDRARVSSILRASGVTVRPARGTREART